MLKYSKYRYLLLNIFNKKPKQVKYKILELVYLNCNKLELDYQDFYFKKFKELYIIKINLKVYNNIRASLIVLEYFNFCKALLSSGCINKLYKYTDNT
jgi:hypothetical protein